MNAKEKAVNAFTWGVLTVGGIVTAAVVSGPMEQHQAEAVNTLSVAESAQAEHAYNVDRALCVGGIVLALPGLGMYLSRPVQEPSA
jgi:hypothetical protein